ncbi:putative GPI-anchored protein pfl2 isoform X2 [Macadamia integrifolia]|uniref:putative GPI-anchored protein pfl2 isoform X2 n=1 Tax=Macadamia integrifolia TaxID=60698 RepID=UPI001C4EA13B|nr:putative GPI-anchored protein pfl2 isoform X2 [Macadamia integrifolia]
MDDSEKRDQETERFHIFDVSFDDDCLIASPSGRTLNLQENQKENDAAYSIRQEDQTPVSSESLELETIREVNKCNMRKSIAWDSAFFTSAGVLDPEELIIINKGFRKAVVPLLPGIQEDVQRSTESNSTFESDSFTLESIEIDLFEDIRASIQKSSKSSNVKSSSSNSGPGERRTQSLFSSKRVGLPSENMTKPIAASKRQTVGIQSLGNTPKKASVRPHVQPASKTGKPSSSSLKPPTILGRDVPISAAPAAPTKRTSSGANRIKIEHNTTKAASGKGGTDVCSKKPKSGDSSSVSPRSSPSPKSSFSVSPSVSSVNRSGSTSSDSRGKSPANPWRNKTSSKNVNPAPFGSTRIDPKRISSRNKADSGNSGPSAHLLSMSKHYSSISPASSIDGWSSESSSSSTVNQRSNYSKTIKSPRSGFSVDNDAPQALDPQTHPHNWASSGRGSDGTELRSECEMKLPMDNNALSHLASTNVPRSIKPSGLRMPSPKIGFFDAEKTALSSPRGGVRSSSPKDGAGIICLNGSSIKTKPGKTQPARTVTGSGKMKSESEHTRVLCPTSDVKPNFANLHEQANASPKVPDDAVKCGSGANAEVNGGLDASKNNIVAKSEGRVFSRAIKTSPSKEVRPYISSEKENYFGIEDQVGSLIRSVGVIDLNPDVLN